MDDTIVHRLCAAVAAHDLDRLVDCFSDDYRNETPAHPGRGFSGTHQVRANWRAMFDRIPDITATVIRTSVAGDEVWSEWEMQGTRPHGGQHLMRGVIIFGVGQERIAWARFYLEPVDAGADGVDGAIAKIVAPRGRP